jgi:hypothetical protein
MATIIGNAAKKQQKHQNNLDSIKKCCGFLQSHNILIYEIIISFKPPPKFCGWEN